LYRIRPSVAHKPFKPTSQFANKISNDFNCDKKFVTDPNQLRWKAIPFLEANEHKNFLEGLITVAGQGSPGLKEGLCIYQYSCNTNMKNTAFSNSDGDLLIVPQEGPLYITTEYGKMIVG
jgi:homogentisate 1,2-dioxygenase